MQISIDNQDGLGALDYTLCVQFDKSAGIVRQLNEATTLLLSMTPALSNLKVPAADAYIQAADSKGELLFTGYVLSAAVDQAAGYCTSGQVASVVVEAVSDEIVLDSEVNLVRSTLLGQSALAAWESLPVPSTMAALPVSVAAGVGSPSRMRLLAGERWTKMARFLGDQARTSHTVLNSQVSVVPIGNTVHTISSQDPGLHLQPSNLNDLRWVAGDITVCGKEEPDAYVTELFQGDGVTADFALTQKPFNPSTSERVSIEDSFQGISLNPSLWRISDPDTHLALTADGLTCNGGTGRDSETVVAGVQQVELGGMVTLEGGSVLVNTGSTGGILGFYAGAVSSQNCIACFGVSTSNGVTSVSPVVNGSVVGASFTPATGSAYLYRLRVYSPETERVRQTYFYESGGLTSSVGGLTVPSAGMIEFEVQQITSGVPGISTVLYCGPVESLPPVATLGVLDSGALNCSIRSVTCIQTFPVWISVGPLGSPVPSFTGASTAGGACHVTSTGKVEFYPANLPASGAVIAINYRSERQAVARRSISIGPAQPAVAASSWAGSVTDPAPLSSIDCDSAAAALLSMASQPSSRLQGTYKVIQQEGTQDIWPGDALDINDPETKITYWAVVRSVAIGMAAGVPAFLRYTVKFANDWAENLSIKTSEDIPEDTVIPQAATSLSTALLSLSALSVESLTNSTVTVSTGVSAPTNGGFEIRRREGTFGPGGDSDLVLRSGASTIALPRSSAVEQFYVRMYDDAQPPNYSLHSAALFINVPL